MSIDGKWNIVMKTPVGDREAELSLKQDGDALSGEMMSDGQTTAIANGKAEGGRLTWDADVTSPMPITLNFDCAVTDDGGIEGTVKLGMFGTSTVTGTAV